MLLFQLVWNYKKNLTKDDRFESAQNEVCTKELHEVNCIADISNTGKILTLLHSEWPKLHGVLAVLSAKALK